jgi:bacillithiol biosynthesis cysteine-adding enzyme BshC
LNKTGSVCIRQTEIPSSTALFSDFLYQFDKVRKFYGHPPDVELIPHAARKVRLDPEHRKSLVEILRRQNHAGGPATTEHLNLLAQPDTVAVATGQQVGLHGGPVFTLYKALTALKLADQLRVGGTPAVAVFWLATEDHDLAEVDHSWVFNERNEPLQLRANAEHEPNQPVGSVSITGPDSETLREALANLPFGEEALASAEAAYRPGGTLESGFTALLKRLLADRGLIFLNPMDAGIRQLAAPLLRKAIENSDALRGRLLDRSAALEEAGYHAQVHVADDSSLLFSIEAGTRAPLRIDDSPEPPHDSMSTKACLARLAETPECFSPNALLRPVTQDFLLPTAAYIGGPAELAYLAQAEVLYSGLLGRTPVVLPRASLTILDARAQRLLRRYALTVTDCFAGPEQLRRSISQCLIPPQVEKSLADSEGRIGEALESARRALEAFDPTLGNALTTTSEKMLYQFGKIRSKAAQECLRRDSRAAADASYLAGLLFPSKTLQERLYSVLPFLARHGVTFVDQVFEAIQPNRHDHQVLTPGL